VARNNFGVREVTTGDNSSVSLVRSVRWSPQLIYSYTV